MANGKISVSTLKEGAKILNVDIGDASKKKDLEKLIDAHLTTMELGYECPACGKDIPDLDQCPYCAESFVEEDENVTEEAADTESTEDDAAEENKESGTEESTEEESAEEAVDDETAEEVAKALVEAPEKPAKPAKNKPAEGRGRPQGKSKNTEEKEKEFSELVAAIDEVLGDEFEKRERKTGITYVSSGKRLLKAVSTGKTLSIEFNVELKSNDDSLVKYTEEEAKAKHLGSTRAIYALGELKTAIKLVKEAHKARA
jgi:hypothetical protein